MPFAGIHRYPFSGFREIPMKGKIKAYSGDVCAGIITGADNQTYSFSMAQWFCKIPPKNNFEVEFDEHQGRIRKIKSAIAA
jgi:hypothetical protein